MNPFCIYLLLPVLCVVSVPTNYGAKQNVHMELPPEFWSQHFGPDFQHAIHLQLQQTHLIDVGNSINKQNPESKDGNKKRSTYVIHESKAFSDGNRNMSDFMKVDILKPNEMKELESNLGHYTNFQSSVTPMPTDLTGSDYLPPQQYKPEGDMYFNRQQMYYPPQPNMIKPEYMRSNLNPWAYNPMPMTYDHRNQFNPQYNYEGSLNYGEHSASPNLEKATKTDSSQESAIQEAADALSTAQKELNQTMQENGEPKKETTE